MSSAEQRGGVAMVNRAFHCLLHNAKGKHGPKTRCENTLLMNLDSRHVTFQQESIRHAQTKEEFWT